MAKKSKHMTGKAFTVEVCDLVRHHIGEGKALKSKRDIAFEDRDAAIEEKAECEDHESDEYLEACKRHSESLEAIDSLSARIAWHRNQLIEAVDKADEPGFDFVYEMPDEPVVKKDPKQLKLADQAEEKPKDTRPVGRPGAKPKAAEPDPSKGDGVDEHMRAAVGELQFATQWTERLISAGLTTIGHIAAVIDDRKRDLAEITGLSKTQAADVTKTVNQYRKKHRSAMVEAER